MTADTIRTYLVRRPFEPFVIKTSAGHAFEVRHPEMVLLAKTGLIMLHADSQGDPTDRWETISYLHIASIESATGTAA